MAYKVEKNDYNFRSNKPEKRLVGPEDAILEAIFYKDETFSEPKNIEDRLKDLGGVVARLLDVGLQTGKFTPEDVNSILGYECELHRNGKFIQVPDEEDDGLCM
jgi:hypothetical protein